MWSNASKSWPSPLSQWIINHSSSSNSPQTRTPTTTLCNDTVTTHQQKVSNVCIPERKSVPISISKWSHICPAHFKMYSINFAVELTVGNPYLVSDRGMPSLTRLLNNSQWVGISDRPPWSTWWANSQRIIVHTWRWYSRLLWRSHSQWIVFQFRSRILSPLPHLSFQLPSTQSSCPSRYPSTSTGTVTAVVLRLHLFDIGFNI